jgi:hypothetical protein
MPHAAVRLTDAYIAQPATIRPRSRVGAAYDNDQRPRHILPLFHSIAPVSRWVASTDKEKYSRSSKALPLDIFNELLRTLGCRCLG